MEPQGAGTQAQTGVQSSSGAQTEKPAEKLTGEKRADKPHTITILLGVLSPGMALMALCVSLYSCRQSEHALEIAQRAYVAVKSGKARLSWMKIGPPQVPGETRPLKPILTMELTINLENAGNTPARFVSFTPDMGLPEGWTVQKREWMPKEALPGELGPKSQEAWLYRQSFELTPAAWEQASEKGILTFLTLSGHFIFKDVFDQQHALDWCWSMPAKYSYDGPVRECIVLVKTE